MKKFGKTTKRARSPKALSDLGKKYFEAGIIDKAIASFKKALEENPKFYEAWFNLGLVYQKQNRFREAIECYEENIKLFGENPFALKNLALCYGLIGESKKTLEIVKTLSFSGDSWETYFNLGTIYQTTKDVEKGIQSFEKSIELNPNFGLTYGQLYNLFVRICDWENADRLVSKVDEFNKQAFKNGGLPAEVPFGNIAREENPEHNFYIAKMRSDAIKRKVLEIPHSFLFRKKDGKKKIRIGYLSSDFHDHATVHLILGLLRLHNRDKFEIYAYSHGVEDESVYRKNVVSAVDMFRDISGLNDKEAAAQIFNDGIDILVDLKGHTNGNRLGILAFRPAPIQAAWLGFPGTTGADFIDYLIADKIVAPPSEKAWYSEKLVYLPGTYQVNDNTQPISKKKFTRADFGLPATRSQRRSVVFSSFNQSYKITRQTFESWMKILKAVPGSFLWLYQKDPHVAISLKREAVKLGIEESRIIFATHIPKNDHLARLGLADIALDTFTYNGHTTTSDCLWAGVPVITLKGKHFASRVSASLLTAIGLTELITKTPKEYEFLAVRLAKSPKLLKLLKEKLAKNRTAYPLFNTKRFVKNLEKAYLKMWQETLP